MLNVKIMISFVEISFRSFNATGKNCNQFVYFCKSILNVIRIDYRLFKNNPEIYP